MRNLITNKKEINILATLIGFFLITLIPESIYVYNDYIYKENLLNSKLTENKILSYNNVNIIKMDLKIDNNSSLKVEKIQDKLYVLKNNKYEKIEITKDGKAKINNKFYSVKFFYKNQKQEIKNGFWKYANKRNKIEILPDGRILIKQNQQKYYSKIEQNKTIVNLLMNKVFKKDKKWINKIIRDEILKKKISKINLTNMKIINIENIDKRKEYKISFLINKIKNLNVFDKYKINKNSDLFKEFILEISNIKEIKKIKNIYEYNNNHKLNRNIDNNKLLIYKKIIDSEKYRYILNKEIKRYEKNKFINDFKKEFFNLAFFIKTNFFILNTVDKNKKYKIYLTVQENNNYYKYNSFGFNIYDFSIVEAINGKNNRENYIKKIIEELISTKSIHKIKKIYKKINLKEDSELIKKIIIEFKLPMIKRIKINYNIYKKVNEYIVYIVDNRTLKNYKFIIIESPKLNYAKSGKEYFEYKLKKIDLKEL